MILRKVSSFIVNLYARLPNIRGKYRLGSIMTGGSSFACKCLGGVWLKLFLTSTNDMAFLRDSAENPVLLDAVRDLNKGDVFVDVGANVGYYSALAAVSVGNSGIVVSIEPSPREYRRLLWARQNNTHAAKWICLNEAASSKSDLLELALHSSHTGMNSFIAKELTAGMVTVSVRPLDSLVSFLPKNRNIDLLKIDVEGWESCVIDGAVELLKARRVNKIIIEVTPEWLEANGSSREVLYETITQYGYKAKGEPKEFQYDEVFDLIDAVQSEGKRA